MTKGAKAKRRKPFSRWSDEDTAHYLLSDAQSSKTQLAALDFLAADLGEASLAGKVSKLIDAAVDQARSHATFDRVRSATEGAVAIRQVQAGMDKFRADKWFSLALEGAPNLGRTRLLSEAQRLVSQAIKEAQEKYNLYSAAGNAAEMQKLLAHIKNLTLEAHVLTTKRAVEFLRLHRS